MERHKNPVTLIALGGNKAPLRSEKELALSNYLSIDSQMTAFAAGLLYKWGYVQKIIFSTGKTSGSGNPSEAESMANYAIAKFGIPKEAIILEDRSIDTKENAKECIKLIRENKDKDVVLLSLGLHAKNAASLFKNHGHLIHQNKVWASERVIYQYLLQKSSDSAKRFMEDFKDHLFFSGIGLRETVRTLLIDTVDPKGNLLHQITKKTRG